MASSTIASQDLRLVPAKWLGSKHSSYCRVLEDFGDVLHQRLDHGAMWPGVCTQRTADFRGSAGQQPHSDRGDEAMAPIDFASSQFAPRRCRLFIPA